MKASTKRRIEEMEKKLPSISGELPPQKEEEDSMRYATRLMAGKFMKYEELIELSRRPSEGKSLSEQLNDLRRRHSK